MKMIKIKILNRSFIFSKLYSPNSFPHIEEYIDKVSFKNLEKLERKGIFRESVKDASGITSSSSTLNFSATTL